jgi:hypothetical protein
VKDLILAALNINNVVEEQTIERKREKKIGTGEKAGL